MSLFPRDDPAPPWDPGRSTGIVGLIFSLSGVFCFIPGLIGAVICIIAFVRSRKAGFRNTYALVGIIVGLAFPLINVLLFLYAPVPGRS